jgi:hypothetical protein
MRLVSLVVLVGLVVWVGCGGGGMGAAPESVTLEYKKMGGEYVQYKASTSVTYNLGGTIRSWLSEMVYSVRIDTIMPDGTTERRMKFDDFMMGDISGSRLSLDPSADKYVGEDLWLKLGPDGELVDWKGLDGVRAYTVENRNLKHVLVQMMAQMFQPMQSGPVSVGSSWQTTVEIPITIRGGDFNQKVIADYQLDGFAKKAGRPCAKIKVSIRFEGEGEGTRGPDRKFWVTSEGEGKGDLWFDYVDGLVVEYNTTATATQDISYERAGKEDVATDFATIDSESKIKLSE